MPDVEQVLHRLGAVWSGSERFPGIPTPFGALSCRPQAVWSTLLCAPRGGGAAASPDLRGWRLRRAVPKAPEARGE
eukprot:8906809-Alexandrium_andersonii.AAC.1